MRRRWIEDQDARSRRVVQLRPRDLDLLQLAENLAAEVLDGFFIVGAGRVCAELLVHPTPGEPLRGCQSKDSIGEPQVNIEAQGRTLERLEGVHVERYRVTHKDREFLAQYGGFGGAMKRSAALQSLPEARVTEGVSIDDYSTWRATRFADPEETG